MSNYKNFSSSPSKMNTSNSNKLQYSYYPENYGRLSAFTGQSDMSFTSTEQQPKKVFDPKDFIMDGMTERDVHIYKQVFDLMDVKATMHLNPGKIRQALKEYGNYNASIELVYQIFSDFDSDMNGQIDFQEFLQMMKMKPCEIDTKEDIQKVYHDINQYRDEQEGITPKDLIDLAANCGEVLSIADAVKIVKKFDPTGQRISKEDFITFNKIGNF